MPTPKPFRVDDEKVFSDEKQNLTNTIEEIYGQRERTEWPHHPIFGTFTTEQTGKILYKHLDHHLRQFGV